MNDKNLSQCDWKPVDVIDMCAYIFLSFYIVKFQTLKSKKKTILNSCGPSLHFNSHMTGFVSFVPPASVEVNPKHHILSLVKTSCVFENVITIPCHTQNNSDSLTPSNVYPVFKCPQLFCRMSFFSGFIQVSIQRSYTF